MSRADELGADGARPQQLLANRRRIGQHADRLRRGRRRIAGHTLVVHGDTGVRHGLVVQADRREGGIDLDLAKAEGLVDLVAQSLRPVQSSTEDVQRRVPR